MKNSKNMAESALQEAKREIAHWESVIARYKDSTHPLDAIMLEAARANLVEWQTRLAKLL